jgi:hypothetical protein
VNLHSSSSFHLAGAKLPGACGVSEAVKEATRPRQRAMRDGDDREIKQYRKRPGKKQLRRHPASALVCLIFAKTPFDGHPRTGGNLSVAQSLK